MQNNEQSRNAAPSTQKLEVALTGDTITLSLKGSLTLSAQQLEDMISSLSLVRARMQPPISADPPEAEGTEFALNPKVQVMADPPGENILTFIRHPMYGWVNMAQSQEEAMQLVLALAEQLKLLDDDQPPTLLH